MTARNFLHLSIERPEKVARISYMTNETFTLGRTSSATGDYNMMEIPLSLEAYAMGMQAWKRGELIQNAFPTLSPEIREFIMSGITPQEWADMFGPEETDDVSDEGFDPYSNTYTDDC